MKIKVCGIRDEKTVSALQDMGVDFVGHIFYTKSPRFVAHPGSGGLARDKVQTIRRVGVFVDSDLPTIKSHLEAFGLHMVQLHGKESPDLCQSVRRLCPVVKAIGVDKKSDLMVASRYAGYVDYLLFDTKTSAHGGSGRKFDWAVLDGYSEEIPFFLSGGIGLGDAHAIGRLRHPMLYGVDINSRFETAPAVKDMKSIRLFINALRI